MSDRNAQSPSPLPDAIFGDGLPDSAEPVDASHLRVLIVDDEPMLRSVIQDFLQMLGFDHLRTAGDGMEALGILRAEPIDCMLSDIRMPKMELEELLGFIRAEFPRLIVIATSGFSDLDSARNIFNKGAHEFIGKPLNLDALELALQWVAERRRILAVTGALFGPAAPPSGFEEGARRLAAQRPFLQSTCGLFETRMRHAGRLADLLGALETGLGDDERLDLQLAALLHEIGTGTQIETLCGKPRGLDADEHGLVHEQARVSGRLLAAALQRPEFEALLGQHLAWQSIQGRAPSVWTRSDRLALWLGLANTLDGCLHDRPDRPAITLGQFFTLFAAGRHAPGSPLDRLVAQRERIAAFYAAG